MNPQPPSPAVSVVIPLYNEEDNVTQLQLEIEKALDGHDYEIIFVDDGSRDATASKVRTGPRVRLIAFEKNAGQSAAMFEGMKRARGAIIALLDGDLQNDPADIPRLLAELEAHPEVSLVCGYRAKRKDTLVKRLTSRVANTVRSRFTKDGVRDTGCSLKAMRRECVHALIPFYGMHRFIPALIKGAGYQLSEIPVNHRPRIAGVSKYGFSNRALKATLDMLGVRWLLSRQLRYKATEK